MRWLLCLPVLLAFWPYDVVADLHPELASQGPSWAHCLGTDHLGRDVAHRLLYSLRSLMGAGAGAAGLCLLAGGLSGAWAGWAGGWAAVALRYVHTVFRSIPHFILSLLLCTLFSNPRYSTLWWLMLACGAQEAPLLAEAIYRRIDLLKRDSFVLALQAHGIPNYWILGYHLLYFNCAPLIFRHIIQAFLQLLLLETTLSYLGGYGQTEPWPSWGNMIAFEIAITGNPLAWLAPSIAILLGAITLLRLSRRLGP